MKTPRQWTLAELREDAQSARMVFRRERLDEPLELYSAFFDAFAPIFSDLIDDLEQIRKEASASQIADLMIGDRRTAFRYLAAPPISDDDLKVLAEARLSPGALRRDEEGAARVRDIVLHILDPHRFGWVKENRLPREFEREAAVIASAALVAAKKVETSRRSNARKAQEDEVRALLVGLGFTQVAKRSIGLLSQGPTRQEFCGESKLGNTRADLVARLFDERVLALECKASNSEVNSFKRVNHEAAGKAKQWLHAFGNSQIVPGAVLSGVFNAANLETAQAEGLNLFWSHRLEDLAEFIQASAPNAP